MSFLGIDIGTSFIKGAVLDIDRRRFGHVRRIQFPDPISGLDPLFCEYDPGDILAAVERLIQDLAEEAGDCEGLVMCSQMSSTILMDSSGNAVSNLIGWRDQRALMEHPSGQGRYFDVLLQKLSDEQRRFMGNELPVGAPLCFLFWRSLQAEHRTGLTPVSLGNYVLRTLCKSPASEELTNVMAFSLLNLTTLDWYREVIEDLGLDCYEWPELAPLGKVVGHLQLAGNSIPCYTPVGDYQCALAGAMLQEGDLSINMSTGSQVSRITRTLELGDYQSRPFFGGQFASTVSHLPAGRSLNVLLSVLTELGRRSNAIVADPWKWVADAVESTMTSDLKVNTAFFPGPAGDRGAITNVSEKNLTVGSLFLAAFENMAENYWSAAGRVWPDHGWRRIILTGGLANKLPALRRAIQEKFRKDVLLCDVTEETLSGLLLLALQFSGRCKTLIEAMDELRPQLGSLQENAGELIGESQ